MSIMHKNNWVFARFNSIVQYKTIFYSFGTKYDFYYKSGKEGRR